MVKMLTPMFTSVIEVVDEAPGVRTYYIKSPYELRPKPGQFNILYVKGFGEVAISISDVIERNGNIILGHTIRAVGAVTKYIYTNILPNSKIGVRGPYGNHWPIDSFEVEGNDILVVAGGIGLAPLRPLIRYVLNNIQKFNSLVLLYGARRPQDMLYKGELRELRTKLKSKVLLSIDKPYEGWYEYVGFVTDLIDKVKIDPSNTTAFVCGPEAMMKVACRKLSSLGIPKDKIYLSLERRMRCGVGICGSCQFGHYFVCKNGPIFNYYEIEDYLMVDGI